MKYKEIIAWQNQQISALNTIAEDYSKYIRKLKKENAELKAKIEKMKCNISNFLITLSEEENAQSPETVQILEAKHDN